jgi:hypothetical protein
MAASDGADPPYIPSAMLLRRSRSLSRGLSRIESATQPESPPLHQTSYTDPPSVEATFRPVTAKAFRRWILRPAEGIFLFHQRAIQRLQSPTRLETARPAAGLCYHLIARHVFLERLEHENPEALSVIEGLPLPDWIILLPMPAAPVLRSTSERTLLRDYFLVAPIRTATRQPLLGLHRQRATFRFRHRRLHRKKC